MGGGVYRDRVYGEAGSMRRRGLWEVGSMKGRRGLRGGVVYGEAGSTGLQRWALQGRWGLGASPNGTPGAAWAPGWPPWALRGADMGSR